MGITPQSKGLHRALAMLDLLCKSSPSATLKIKGKLPREYPWMKRRVEENNWYEGLLTSYPHLFETTKSFTRLYAGCFTLCCDLKKRNLGF